MVEAPARDRIRLVIDVKPDVDLVEWDTITTELRERVLDVVAVHDVERVPDPAPERGTMAGEVFIPGQLDVLVPLAAVAIHQVFSTIRTYIRERPVLSVTIHRDGNLIDLEINGTTRDVEPLVRHYLDAPGSQAKDHGD